MKRFDNKVVLVTGAATGIARATVEYLNDNGASIYGIGLAGDEGRRVYAKRAPSCVFRETDVRDTAAIQAAADDLLQHFGRLDAVINCVGIQPSGKRVEDLSDEEWDNAFAVNLSSVFKVCRATLPLLRDSGGGSVVNIASVIAEAGAGRQPAYTTSKAGVVALSRQMAIDYAVDGIRVNSIMPGYVSTPMSKLHADSNTNSIGRVATPIEIATAIGFLISSEASFVTGSNMRVDGGLLAGRL